MKTKHIILVLICLFMSGNAEAQILKKLRKKAEKAVERTILKKTDSIVTKKTEKAIDSIAKGNTKKSNKTDESLSDEERAQGIMDIMMSQTPKDAGIETGSTDMSAMGEPSPAPTDNNIKLPDSYQFSYNATMQVKNNQGTVETEYYLQPNETYYAKKQVSKDFTEYVVYDNQRNMEVSFFEIEESKISARKKMDFFTKAKMVGAYRDAPNRVVKPIGNKTMLGYNCEGYEISTDAGTTQLWVTSEAPATMYSALFTSRSKETDSPFNKNTMVMETTFTSANNSAENYHLQCTQLQTNTMEFSINDYKQ